MACYQTSDNKFFRCPARMSDGRHFTDYRPNCHINNLISNPNGIQNSHEQRLFLTRNAKQIMAQNLEISTERNGCGPCSQIPGRSWSQGTMLPARYVVSCDGNKCERKEVNPRGLGDVRQYGPLPGHGPEPKEQIRPKNCCMNVQDQFYVYENVTNFAGYPRFASPHGGHPSESGDRRYP